MIKQSKLSKICWALVYLLPLIVYLLNLAFNTSPAEDIWTYFLDVFEEIPYIKISFFSISPLSDLIGNGEQVLDLYLGYLVLISLFRIVWKVLVYLPDVVGKLIDRWSL